MKFRRWVKCTENLWTSGDGKYAISRVLDELSVFWFDGVGWGPILDKPVYSLTEAQRIVEWHRYHRPLHTFERPQ